VANSSIDLEKPEHIKRNVPAAFAMLWRRIHHPASIFEIFRIPDAIEYQF